MNSSFKVCQRKLLHAYFTISSETQNCIVFCFVQILKETSVSPDVPPSRCPTSLTPLLQGPITCCLSLSLSFSQQHRPLARSTVHVNAINQSIDRSPLSPIKDFCLKKAQVNLEPGHVCLMFADLAGRADLEHRCTPSGVHGNGRANPKSSILNSQHRTRIEADTVTMYQQLRGM